LRLVQFDITLPGFVPVSSTRYSKIYLLDRSTIRVEGLKSFTLTSPEIYGVVIDPAAEELAVTKPSGAGQATPAPTETPGPSPTPLLPRPPRRSPPKRQPLLSISWAGSCID
jgi:hypothetical protein